MRDIALKTAASLLGLSMLAAPGLAEENAPTQASANAHSIAAANARMAAVQAHVDAYRSGDLNRFVSTFTKDAVVRADGYVAIGHDQIKALYSLNFEPGAPSIRVHESGVDGDLVYLKVGYVFESGEEMCCSYSEYQISDGRVSFLQSGM